MRTARRDVLGRRRAMCALAVMTAALVGAVAPVRAQTVDPILLAPFDPDAFSAPALRRIQIGATAAGFYDGLLDGAWGDRSQAALDGFAAREYGLDRATNAVAAAAARYGDDFSARYGFRDVEFGGSVSVMLPLGALVRVEDAGDLVAWRSKDGGFRVSIALGARDDSAHDYLANGAGDPEDYVLRRDDRWVTARRFGDGAYAVPGRVYLRSDRLDGAWATLSISSEAEEDLLLLRLIASSHYVGPPRDWLNAPTPYLDRVQAALDLYLGGIDQ